MVTVWTPQAIAELRKAYDYISKDSPQNARKVVEELTAIADRLPTQPEMFPPDKFKKNNDGAWRAFEKYHYRLSYLITPREIRIVRMRHTSRTPMQY
ncbi:MAG TPA: type II toxin-antitoxin system RelE/ParE family toxin [Puia sp.]|jgi:plasmid stabilization system protein ParE